MPRRFYDKGQKREVRVAAWKRAHDAGVAGTLSEHRIRQHDEPAPSDLYFVFAGERPPEQLPPPMPLTPAELAPLVLLSHGLTEKATAKMLGKPLETVRTHTKRARAKLDASNITEACCEALRRGLID